MNKRITSHLGWPIVIGLILIPLILWASAYPLSYRFGTTASMLGSLGNISGMIAIVLFCVNILLSTRLRFFEEIFGGLNKVYIAHHISGGLSLCVVLIHPIALSLQKTTVSFHQAATFWWPHLNQLAIAMGIIALWSFIFLMVITFFTKLPYRIWLFSHRLFGGVLLLIILHVILLNKIATPSKFLTYYYLTLLALATLAFIYRTLLPRFFVRNYKYKITRVTQPSPGMARIFMMPVDKPMVFQSGQFIFVSFEHYGISRESHPFSISSNEKNQELSITVKSLGVYTDTLVKLAPKMIGDVIRVEGAFGKFSFKNFHAKRQIWIAGGIGITPFLGMIQNITTDYKVDLYYSVKNEAEMIDYQDLAKMAAGADGHFRFIPFVADKQGFLTADVIKKTSGDLQNAEVLLCGPPPMMHALTSQLQKAGMKKWSIHSEEFAMS